VLREKRKKAAGERGMSAGKAIESVGGGGWNGQKAGNTSAVNSLQEGCDNCGPFLVPGRKKVLCSVHSVAETWEKGVAIRS
jgi:hypothetical protein